MTQTRGIERGVLIGDPDESVKAFRARFRFDVRSLRAQAADLRRRAEDLEAAAERATAIVDLFDDVEAVDRIRETYRGRWAQVRAGSDDRSWTLGQTVRYLTAADEAFRRPDGSIAGDRTTAHFHAAWAVRGNAGNPCGCVPCFEDREGGRR